MATSSDRAVRQVDGSRFPTYPAGGARTRDVFGGQPLSRHLSCPQGKITSAGHDVDRLMNSKPINVQPTAPCTERRRDHILGYRGFIPGVKAETVFGASPTKASATAFGIRPPASPIDKTWRTEAPKDMFPWHCPPDKKKGKRMVKSFSDPNCKTIEDWVEYHNGCSLARQEKRDYGPAMQGYCGHHAFRLGHPRVASTRNDVLLPGIRFSLDHMMSVDRDCQPWDAYRAQIPGYSGYVSGKNTATDERHLPGRSGFNREEGS